MANDNLSAETIEYINSRLGVKLNANNEFTLSGPDVVDYDNYAPQPRVYFAAEFSRGEYELYLMADTFDGDHYGRCGVTLVYAKHASLVHVVKSFKAAYAAKFSRFGL